ncbi:MAG: hypothetical protein JSR64_09665 [Nitrospira sp.]|nr:hypothetical protein [Nitrospira sp.]MBS0194382.1 hypothetical protein [Pseudomonadota bacterium]
MEQPFFAGFTPDQKREVALALDQVRAIRDAYVEVSVLSAEATGADLASSSNPTVVRERGEAIAATHASSEALMHELVDYSDTFAMSPTSRAGAARFVQQLHLAREGDVAALATVTRAKQELSEAEQARADFGTGGKRQLGTVAAGDRPLDRPGVMDEPTTAKAPPDAKPGTIEVVSAVRADQASLQTALPEHFKHRYIRAGESIVDANSPARLILVDKGRRLHAPDEFSTETVAALVDIAETRTWRSINVKGTPEFKAAVYLEAASRGLAVKGYSPSRQEQDIAAAAYARRQQMELEASERSAGNVVAAVNGFAAAITAEAEPGGRIVKHGRDHYKHDREEKMSYFVTLETAAGERTVWGLDLERALREAGARTGDRVRLEHQGDKPVEVDANKRDAEGRVVGQERIATRRNAWAVRRLDAEATLPGASSVALEPRSPDPARADTAKAFLSARSEQEREDAVRKHPELRAAFAAEALAVSAATTLKPYSARQAFLQRFRDAITKDLAAGRQLPDVPERVRQAREQRDRDASQAQAQTR